jgi:L-fuculose-phosphate aldolase
MKAESALANKIVLAAHILAQKGHGDEIFGHITVRGPHQNEALINPVGIGLEEVRPESVLMIDLNGNRLKGSGRVPAEYPIHTEIYKMYPSVNCVIHTHPFYSLIVGATLGSIKPISHEGVLFAKIPVFGTTTKLINTSGLGQGVAHCLHGHSALLMRNHGIVVTGTSIEQATVFSILLEKAAKVQVTAHSLGPSTCSSEEETQEKIEQIYSPAIIESLWNYHVRKLGTAQTEEAHKERDHEYGQREDSTR